MTKSLDIWVLSEGIAGTENQCLGIAEALGGNIITKRVGLKWPFSWFSPYISWGEGPGMLTQSSDPIAAPYPDVLIAGGRKAVGIARYIKRTHPKTLICIVQHPRVPLAPFDLVAAPYHDSLCGPNVVVTDGACNRVSEASLDAARARFQDLIAPLPVPRVAVLVGGTSKTHRMTAATMDRLIAHLRDTQQRYKTSLMITVSRRTPPELAQRLATEMAGPQTLIYTGQGENPYHGFLAYADYFVCTSDSVSMISDAATVGRPIDIFALPGGTKRHQIFLGHLRDLGISIDCRDCPKLNDAQKVADRINALLTAANGG
jgi:uncharacterized protein